MIAKRYKHGEEQTLPSIIIDDRERQSRLYPLLTERFTVKVQRLSYGDYLINNGLVIERKTARDFLISIIDLRLFKQVANLKKHCDSALLLIEGDLLQTGGMMDHRSITGALLSVQASWQLPVIFSESAAHSCDILEIITRQRDTFSDNLVLRGGYRPKKIKTRQLYILQGLPGVGPSLAKRLLEHFKSVAAVMNASTLELQHVQGLGVVKANDIRKILDRHY